MGTVESSCGQHTLLRLRAPGHGHPGDPYRRQSVADDRRQCRSCGVDGYLGTLFSEMALAGMAGRAMGGTVGLGRRERVEAVTPQRVGHPRGRWAAR